MQLSQTKMHPSDFLHRRLPRLLTQVFLWLLVCYIAILLAKLTWTVYWPERGIASLYQGAPDLQAAVAAPEIGLAKLDLFGGAQSAAGVAAAIVEAAPETRLQLILQGVVLAEQAGQSSAIVAQSQGDTDYYHVGDLLPGQAELVGVESNRILLRRNGHIETLSFEDNNGLTLGAGTRAGQANLTPEAFLEQARLQLSQDANAALGSVGLRSAGAGAGYVYDGSNAMLSALNLKAGDRLVAVNGNPLGDPGADQALLQQWAEQGQVEIEIERDGARMTINYRIPGR